MRLQQDPPHRSIAALLPAGIAVATSRFEGPTPPLCYEEWRHVRDAARVRQRQFATGRSCAREALRRMGHLPAAIPVGDGRQPMWPEGVVGSITHSGGLCAAAVAASVDYAAIGIDVEANCALEPAVWELIAHTDDERRWARSSNSRIAWDVVLFSIKESVFKAWWPHHRRWLGFDDVRVMLEPEVGEFSAEVLVPSEESLRSMRGSFSVDADLIVSVVSVRNRAAAAADGGWVGGRPRSLGTVRPPPAPTARATASI